MHTGDDIPRKTCQHKKGRRSRCSRNLLRHCPTIHGNCVEQMSNTILAYIQRKICLHPKATDEIIDVPIQAIHAHDTHHSDLHHRYCTRLAWPRLCTHPHFWAYSYISIRVYLKIASWSLQNSPERLFYCHALAHRCIGVKLLWINNRRHCTGLYQAVRHPGAKSFSDP